MTIKNTLRELCPPILWKGLSFAKRNLVNGKFPNLKSGFAPKPDQKKPSPDQQDLELYWDPEMAELLEEWGEGTSWSEIEFLLANCNGKILDIACGTGKNIQMLSKFWNIEIHGCDISDFLIQRAIARGIPQVRLQVCDATKMSYAGNSFDYAYSIGSFEHFTENGIAAVITETYRVAKYSSFHMLPVSRSGENEGWMKTVQTFHNNSVEWWLEKFKSSYGIVYVLDSKWEDNISVGKWFICIKEIRA
jgi:SAM-dependent methyltransferase